MELKIARNAQTVLRHGGKVLADALVAQGIDHVFEVPGESFLDTLDGLYDQGGKIKLVTCRFEAGAVNMADAYGKLTGRPAAATRLSACSRGATPSRQPRPRPSADRSVSRLVRARPLEQAPSNAAARPPRSRPPSPD